MDNMMNELNEIFAKYTSGEYTVDEANEKLEELGSDLRIDENNEIAPDEVDKYGMLDMGLGSMSKVEVNNGKLVDNDMGDMIAYCTFKGVRYEVKGDTLVGYNS